MPIRSDKIRQTTFKHAVETDFKRPQRFHKLVVKAIRKVAAQRVTDANGDQATEQKCRMAFDQLAYCESKKGPLYFCPYLSQILTDFQNFFNIELRIKYTTKQLLYFTTNPERVATISCEIINCTNDVIFYRR
jgi:hypothetical protein